MAAVNKVIVTHTGALRGKHGTKGMKKIDEAIDALIQADAQRGVATRLVAIDRKTDMKGIGKAVSKSGDRRQAKRAIDDVYGQFKPHYLMLLGAPDVIPHQRLVNPLHQSGGDPDARVESDLPYACNAGYSTNINDFLGPTRVVGRLPDVQGTGDTDYLLKLLAAARGWKRRSRRSYKRCFGISTEAWKQSTRTSVRKLFGSQKGVNLSPDDGPKWTKAELRDRVHFINCHGDTAKAEFYGENENDRYDQPVAHESTHLAGRLREGTVVAAECCFGAELYEPFDGGSLGICQAYLAGGASGFFGSTTIAYGPAIGNGEADLICIEFVRAVLDGASLGRAALTAQQKYISSDGHMGPHDLKTVAQFVLLGDPSVHPVKPSASRRKKSRAKAKAAAAEPRVARRKALVSRGRLIGASTATVSQKADARLSAKLKNEILKRCAGFAPLAMLSFNLRAAARPARTVLAKRLTAAKKTTFHVLMEKQVKPPPVKPPVKPVRMVIAREVDGKLEEVVETFRH